MATMTVEGRRVWIKTQFGESCVDGLKRLGAHWDSERRAWWLTSAKKAEVEGLLSLSSGAQSHADAQASRLAYDQNHILGRATYEGQSYYLVGQGTSERGPWVRLMFRDGSKTFFAKDAAAVEITKIYQKPQTLEGLREFAERRKREQETGICECWCHSSYQCHCEQGFCSFHHDGCDSCGCEN